MTRLWNTTDSFTRSLGLPPASEMVTAEDLAYMQRFQDIREAGRAASLKREMQIFGAPAEGEGRAA